MRGHENFQNFCLFWELVVETNQKPMVGVEMVLVEAVKVQEERWGKKMKMEVVTDYCYYYF